uniref:Uncharacterized protein n=1 Tax=Desertifilum tharense IPPAS B-1220 TaxID=1781255 RepID=A0ACD5GRW0_9CYAN
MALVKDNHNPRLYNPSLLPLAIAIGILAVLSYWTKRRLLAAIATALIVFQVAVIVTPTPGEPQYKAGDLASKQLLWGNPTSVLRRLEQWDWSLLREVAQQQGIHNPLIAYLGNDSNLNPPQIAFPWVKNNEPARVTWLWNSVTGDIDWEKVMSTVKLSDLVITVPELEGDAADRSDLDNQYNGELVERLQQDPQFAPPVPLKLGYYHPIEALVFVRQSVPAIRNRKRYPFIRYLLRV